MTDANRTATDTDLAAADWIQRRHLWEWTQADQAEFDTWLADSDANRLAYLRQNAVWRATERLGAFRPQQPMLKVTPVAKSGKWTLFRYVAAAAIVAAVGVSGVQYFQHPSNTTYVTPVGGHKIILLSDGTRIELNTDSALRISSNALRRVTLLRGEAYFDVQHNGADPFAVTASGYRITDLGTKFSVRTSPIAVRVSLLEGSAAVTPVIGQKAHRSALLMPGDVAVASADTLTVKKEPVASVATSLGWRHGLLTFKDTELADAVAEFNRYNTAKLHISDAVVGHLKINGTFQAENADVFAASVQELFGLKISRNTGNITLSH
ncbi:MAG TPA: FecR domain-containing protein [Terriglobales bacterium]|nr:FecR domain-containing protein [Terriglobales bacterium]